MNKIKRQFFSGLVLFVPLALTIYFFWLFFLVTSQALWLALTHQHWLTLPRAAIRPISFLLTLFLVWFLGLVASNFLGRRVVQGLEKGIRYLPFFRGLYEAIQKVTEAFFGSNPIYQSAVLVEYPRRGVYTFGFVTNRLSAPVFPSKEPHLCVFIPTVPNPTSGLLLYIPESETIPLTLTVEEAVKILVSHGFVPIQENAVMARKESHV
jgi:uncharacterized membrane protein